MIVSGAERRQDRIEIRPLPAEALARGRKRGFERPGGLGQMRMVRACASRGAGPPDAVRRFVKQHLRRAEHRVVGSRAAGAGGREHQQSGELGGHVTQVFEVGTGREDVRDRQVVERVGHGHGLYKQKG